MTRSISGARRAALLLAVGTAAASTLLLSGCGAGQIAETAAMAPAVSGVNAQTADNKFKIRNLAVAYPGTEGYKAGATAPLHVVLYNDSIEVVTVKVSTTSARSVALGTGSGASTAPGAGPAGPSAAASVSASPSAALPGSGSPSASASGSPTASTSASGSASPSGTASASGSASPTPSASASSVQPAGPASIQLPANSFVVLDKDSGSVLQLVGLTGDLAPGQAAQLTFDFGGQQITTPAPMAVPLTPAPTAPPVVEGGEHG